MSGQEKVTDLDFWGLAHEADSRLKIGHEVLEFAISQSAKSIRGGDMADIKNSADELIKCRIQARELEQDVLSGVSKAVESLFEPI